jgi:HTH-type transcriptional regulator / antitoxin HigA
MVAGRQMREINIMTIKPIRSRTDHQRALARIGKLMALDPAPGTPEGDELEVLAQVVEGYEKKHFDLGEPEPKELIAFAMEQRGLTKKDMIPFLGTPSRVSEILSGKRSLTLPMIAKLHRGLNLPLASLVMGTVSIPRRKARKAVLSKQAGKLRPHSKSRPVSRPLSRRNEVSKNRAAG